MGYAKGMLRRCVSAQMSGDLEFAMIALLVCATRPAEFFADRAYRAMKVQGGWHHRSLVFSDGFSGLGNC